MINVAMFTYAKDNGVRSERTVAVFHQPTKFLAGVDISELDEEAQGSYLAELSDLRQQHELALAALSLKHDLRSRYRQFAEEKITNLKTEHI